MRHRPPSGSLNLATTAAGRKSVFAIAPYVVGASGQLRVQLPDRCVCAEPGQHCPLRIDHYRVRKTGPGFPLAVVRCRTHGGGRYTLYPPGQLPYSRQPAVACSPDGPLLRQEVPGAPAWAATRFAAALDAADRCWWPADSPAGDPRRRRTQGRQLAWAERLLGLDPDVTPTQRERLASGLRVPALALLSWCRTVSSRWRARGQAVRRVLAALPVDAGLLDRVLAAGAATGLWPPPRRWDPPQKAWLPLAPRTRRRRATTLQLTLASHSP